MVVDGLHNIYIDIATRKNQDLQGMQNIGRPIKKQKQVNKYTIVIF
jgi:hypothetical protein